MTQSHLQTEQRRPHQLVFLNMASLPKKQKLQDTPSGIYLSGTCNIFFCICLANAIAITDLWCFLSLCIRIQHQLPILELKANELFPWILVVTKQHFLAMVSMIIKTHFLITIWVTISRIASLMAASISFFGDERSLYEVIWMNPSYSVRSPST
jgi:hypothetical protein